MYLSTASKHELYWKLKFTVQNNLGYIRAIPLDWVSLCLINWLEHRDIAIYWC